MGLTVDNIMAWVLVISLVSLCIGWPIVWCIMMCRLIKRTAELEEKRDRALAEAEELRTQRAALSQNG